MSELTKNLPRDVFLYFLAMATLLISAISFGILVFQYINIYFPDPLSDFGGRMSYSGSVRSSLAFLIVIFPVYVWASWFLCRDIRQNPEKNELKIRKWLLYFTVFAAGLVIIGDLVALLNTFLEGEITARFVLKVLAIFFIAGSIFYYYISELKSGADKNKANKWLGASWFPPTVIFVVLVSVVLGFFVIGSPTDRRAERFDERRVQDLSYIQSHVINYWQSKGGLPQHLDALELDILGIIIPTDPRTGEPYGYSPLGNLQFELCADFETEGGSLEGYFAPERPVPVDSASKNSVWDHGVGRVCFERTIDPDFFKPRL